MLMNIAARDGEAVDYRGRQSFSVIIVKVRMFDKFQNYRIFTCVKIEIAEKNVVVTTESCFIAAR